MSVPDFSAKFLIDKWYKLTAYASYIILVLSLFHPTQYIENKYVILISLGVLLYSVVEWNQWKTQGLWLNKISSIWDFTLKIIAILLIILPLLKLSLGIELIPF